MQSNPNRAKMSWVDYWFNPFCNCCYKHESWNVKRKHWPHTRQNRMSKVVTLRTHRDGSNGRRKRKHGDYLPVSPVGGPASRMWGTLAKQC
jgi:hypothetical protein